MYLGNHGSKHIDIVRAKEVLECYRLNLEPLPCY